MSTLSLKARVTALLAFVTLTAVVTYPQILGLTSVPYHSDPFFSMWRLGWVAHQLVVDPRHMFEANIFFPEHDTLGYSDAMLLPAVVLSPLFWLGINPAIIYNVALLAAMALSGFTAFALAHRLTGNAVAGIAAGMVYAFAPYRFDHYMHLELQSVFWLPIALMLIDRIVAEGRARDGVLLGAVVAAQTFSSVYAAIFFVAYCAIFIPLVVVSAPTPRSWRPALPLAVAAALTLTLVVPYVLAYQRASRTVGTRTIDDVRHYGASLANYAAAPSSNRMYGETLARLGADELFLFPGAAAIAFGFVGALGAKGRMRFAYLGALILAFDLSRGLDGWTYGWLFEHVSPFRALRSPARIGILVNLSIAVLCAYGVAWVLLKIRHSTWRLAAGAAIVVVLIIEYASAPVLTLAPAPSKADSWLAKQPPVVVIQFPMTRDWLYMFQGISHPQKMLNGYSGYVPASYPATREAMRSFPDDRSLSYLRNLKVDYVILRGQYYPPVEWSELLARIQTRPDLSLVALFPDDDAVYAVRK